ncbi:Di-and tricarboxylate transporter [Natronincola peptidivorans]|uniref:Di-and tricarboxylate transporter n=1 Tax=Natronincola peptidivorans TaxID=426128 RepID=A0A1I0G5J2_9FIRM|nr:anion permease [Natronincola peptidivorans]SET66016.1 Di-and tricarboxylate transporter [Natronincola peptidivorans]
MKKTLIPLVAVLFILIYKPFNLDFNQSLIMASFILTIFAWIIGMPNKIISSSFLLLIFILFGNTPVEKIISFPLSANFLLIVFSFVFSQGVINSNLAEKLFQPFITKYARNVYQLIFTMAALIMILVFIIPQPFSRVILMSVIYQQYFESIKLHIKTRQVLMFALFSMNIIVHTFYKRGDIILNNVILAIANVQMSEIQWMKYLMVPGMAMLLLALTIFIIAFNKELKLFKPGRLQAEKISLTKDDKINLAIISITMILWATESIHGISGAIVVLIGTGIMYFRKIVGLKDFKSINIEILVFLTAAFSIGTVMVGSGIADQVFNGFTALVPNELSLKLIFIIVLSTMVMHMMLGSNVTTVSVAIPSFISILGNGVSAVVIMFLVFLSTVSHYLLPFHNSLLVVGEGNNYFTNKIVFKFGVLSTILTLVSIFLFFVPWWKFVGLI